VKNEKPKHQRKSSIRILARTAALTKPGDASQAFYRNMARKRRIAQAKAKE
jgi:hypothetical protein